MSRRHYLIVGPVVAVTSSLVGARLQAQCDPAQSAAVCFDRERARVRTTVATAAVAEVEPAVAEKPTGSEPSAAGTSTAIKDFLPQFASALSIPGFTGSGKGLDLVLNLKPSGSVWKLPVALQLKALSTEPKVYEELLAAMPEQLRSSRQDSIAKTLGDFDDIALSGSINLESRRWGRSFRSHDAAISKLAAELLSAYESRLVASDRALRAVVAGAVKQLTTGDCTNAKMQIPLTCFDEATQITIATAVTQAGGFAAGIEKAEMQALKDAHFDQIENLLNNQQQLNFSGKYLVRREVVGPTQGTGSFRWEYSPVNLKAAQDYCGKRNGGRAELTPSCYQAYLNQPGVLASLERGDRVWLNVDLSQTQAYDFAIAGDTARIVKPHSFAVEPAIGGGAYILAGGQRFRVDAEVRYRLSSEKKVRENRLVGSTTITQKVSDQSSAVFTIKWANKPEFLGDVDKKVTAHIGLSFKMSDISK